VARVLELPLLRLDRVLAVRLRGLPGFLWFTPGPIDAEVLVAEGVERGRVWTTQELLDFLRIPNLTPALTDFVVRAKLALGDGMIAAVRTVGDRLAAQPEES
jgi:hypothetical protein